MKFRRFTKTDWMELAGAEKFSNGTDPYISEKELVVYSEATRTSYKCLVVIDGSGIGVIGTNEEMENELIFKPEERGYIETFFLNLEEQFGRGYSVIADDLKLIGMKDISGSYLI